MVAAVRTVDLMPPTRWIVPMNANAGETLGQLLKRSRLERGLGQKEVAAYIGLSPDQQSLLSRYERDAIARPNIDLLDRLADFYGIAQETIALAVHRLGRSPTVVPPNSVAIPNEPELLETIEELFPLEHEDMRLVRQFARYVRESEAADVGLSPEERIASYARYLAERSRDDASDRNTAL